MEPNEEIIKQAWRMYRQMDLSAVQYKRVAQSRRWLILGCIIFAAVLAAGGTIVVVGLPSWIASAVGYGAALFFGLGAVFSQASSFKDAEKSWTALRISAEYLKRQVYLYRSLVGDYSGDDAHKNMASVLERESEITTDTRVVKVDDAELLKGCPTGKIDIETYIKERIEDQMGWFRRKSANHDKWLGLLEKVTLLLSIVGVILGLIGQQIWIATFSAAVLAIQVFIQEGRYKYLSTTYQTTAYKLNTLLSQYRAGLITANDLVLGTEQVITYETVASMNEFSREGPKLSM
jgi:hypothetical protein